MTGHLKAQCFDIDDDIGCVPHTINITRCTTDPVFYDYGEGVDFNETYTFTSPGVYPVRQIAGTGGDFDTLTKFVTILDNPEPQVSLFNCANNIIVLNIEEDIYDNYSINFGDGTNETLNGNESTTKSYADDTERTVTVNGSYDEASCSNQTTLTTALFDALVPPVINNLTITNEAVTNGNISLDLDISPLFEYKIKLRAQGAGTFTTIDTIGPSSAINTYIVNNLNTQEIAYDFQIEAFDRCLASENSNIVSSIVLDTSTTISSINLNWNTSSGIIDHYEVIKNSQAIDNGTSVLYNDLDLTCNETYCYQIAAYDSPSHVVTYSSEKCVASPVDTDPLPITSLNISVEDNLNLIWTPPADVKTYTWSRAVNGSGFSALAAFSTSGNSQTDNNANPTDENCYQLNYIDNCDNTPSSPISACNLLLSLDQLDGDYIALSWTDYSYFTSGLLSYTIQFLNNGAVLNSVDNGTTANYAGVLPESNVSSLQIRIMATANDGSIVYSNTIEANFFAEIHFPNAFTPNGDGLNDVFAPKGQFIQGYELYIFTRQGELIFHSESFETGWDGYLPNNNKATEGVYSFVAEVTGTMGEKFTKKGTFTLLN